jgi:hypothetical protein
VQFRGRLWNAGVGMLLGDRARSPLGQLVRVRSGAASPHPTVRPERTPAAPRTHSRSARVGKPPLTPARLTVEWSPRAILGSAEVGPVSRTLDAEAALGLARRMSCQATNWVLVLDPANEEAVFYRWDRVP